MNAETGIELGRTQPEFGLGERMRAIEIAQLKDDQYAAIVAGLEEALSDQKLDNVRSEMDTKDKARQDAIDKAEKAAQERAAALATELRQFTDQAQTRFGALERGGAGLSGEKLGSGDFEIRSQVEKTAQREKVYIILGFLTLIAYLIQSGHIH